jgi:hypothetical protein
LSDDGSSRTETFSVLLRNTETPILGNPIHIFGADETNGPENRLEPGGERGYLVPLFDPNRDDADVRFTAGRSAKLTCVNW